MNESLLDVLGRARIAMVTRRYTQGEIISGERRREDGLFIVTLGIVALSADYSGDKTTTLRLLQKGQTFGYPFVDKGSSWQAQAFTGCEVSSVATGSLEYVMRRHPEVALQMVSMRESDLLFHEELAARLMHRKTEVRLSGLLLELATRFGETSETGEQTIGLQLTHEEFARMIAATREGVTNAINRWKRKGIVATEDRGIVILDRRTLEATRNCDVPDGCGANVRNGR